MRHRARDRLRRRAEHSQTTGLLLPAVQVGDTTITFDAVDVPEPAGVLLLALGLAGFGLVRWLPSRLTR